MLRSDLAVVNEASNNVTVLLDSVDTNGNVTFTKHEFTDCGWTAPVAIATGDLNADGVPDLAVVNQGDNTVSVLLGSSNLDGTFTEATDSPLQLRRLLPDRDRQFCERRCAGHRGDEQGVEHARRLYRQGKGTFCLRASNSTLPWGPPH